MDFHGHFRTLKVGEPLRPGETLAVGSRRSASTVRPFRSNEKRQQDLHPNNDGLGRLGSLCGCTRESAFITVEAASRLFDFLWYICPDAEAAGSRFSKTTTLV